MTSITMEELGSLDRLADGAYEATCSDDQFLGKLCGRAGLRWFYGGTEVQPDGQFVLRPNKKIVSIHSPKFRDGMAPEGWTEDGHRVEEPKPLDLNDYDWTDGPLEFVCHIGKHLSVFPHPCHDQIWLVDRGPDCLPLIVDRNGRLAAGHHGRITYERPQLLIQPLTQPEPDRPSVTFHNLKIDQAPFDDLVSGRKMAEVRNDDRGYCVGDLVTITAPDGQRRRYEIGHIQRGYGLPEGLCVLSVLGLETCPEEPDRLKELQRRIDKLDAEYGNLKAAVKNVTQKAAAMPDGWWRVKREDMHRLTAALDKSEGGA